MKRWQGSHRSRSPVATERSEREGGIRRWTRFIPHSYWLLLSAAILLAVIGVIGVSLWQNGVVGDWANFLYGLVTVVFLAVALTTLITFRRDQL